MAKHRRVASIELERVRAFNKDDASWTCLSRPDVQPFCLRSSECNLDLPLGSVRAIVMDECQV